MCKIKKIIVCFLRLDVEYLGPKSFFHCWENGFSHFFMCPKVLYDKVNAAGTEQEARTPHWCPQCSNFNGGE